MKLYARALRIPRRVAAGAWVLISCALMLVVLQGVRSVYEHGLYGSRGARIYYDAYHGAHHLWNRDNRRHRHSYHTVSGYSRFYRSLLEAGFEVDVATDHGFDRELLADYDAYYVGEQTRHGNFMTEREVEDLLDWVEDGGGLFVTAEHTNAYHMNDVVNRLLAGVQLRARNDGISDRKQTAPFSSDWVVISAPTEGEVHPVAEEVDAYMLFAGCSVDSPAGVLFSTESSWSDRYGAHTPPLFPADGKQQKDELTGPLAGVAALEHGDGRIVLVCDHNAFSNPNLYWGDHHRFARQSLGWLAGPRLNPGAKWAVVALIGLLLLAARRRRRPGGWRSLAAGGVLAGSIAIAALGMQSHRVEPVHDLLLYRPATAATRLMTKKGGGHYTFYASLTRDPHLRPWVDDALATGYDALILVAPTAALSEAEVEIVDGYLAAGKTVLYLANRRSIEAEAGRQLEDHFGFEVTFGKRFRMPSGQSELPYEAHGPPELLAGIFRFWVSARFTGARVSGLEPVVMLTEAGMQPPSAEDEVVATASDEDRVLIDLLSERRVGPGTFTLLMPLGLFDTTALGELYDPQDLVREQMRELSTRIGARAAGHDWAAELRLAQ